MLAQYTITIDAEELTPELEQALDEFEADLDELTSDFEFNHDVEINLESN
jgi:hypothetical protein